MKRNNYAFGREGEIEAVRHLKKQGYEILETNWYYNRYEIDIIAKKGEVLVVVEVKTRATDYFGDPEDAVDYIKRRKIVECADAYIEEKDLDLDVRFDIIAILKTKEKTLLRHIDDAFLSFEM
ncbi:MAG: YraN family protein [Bacteroidota bacterium]